MQGLELVFHHWRERSLVWWSLQLGVVEGTG